MSIAAGIVFATTTLVTFTWATLGRQLAAVPAVAKVAAYLDGGFRMPSEAYVDELMRVHETESAFGLVHEDDEMPGMRGLTYGEVIKMDATKPRGAFRGDIPRSHAFSDELPSVARLPNPTGLCG